MGAGAPICKPTVSHCWMKVTPYAVWILSSRVYRVMYLRRGGSWCLNVSGSWCLNASGSHGEQVVYILFHRLLATVAAAFTASHMYLCGHHTLVGQSVTSYVGVHRQPHVPVWPKSVGSDNSFSGPNKFEEYFIIFSGAFFDF